MPRDCNRVAHYVFSDLTLHCGRMFNCLRRVTPFPVRGLRVVNKNSQGGLLGRFAYGTINMPIVTNPDRKATVNGVVLRTGTGKLMDSVTTVHRLVDASVRAISFRPRRTRR